MIAGACAGASREESRDRAEAAARVVRASSTARCSSPRRARRSARRCSWCAASAALARARSRRPRAARRDAASSFTTALTRENHTLKRALTDPHLFSGIGNAYSDEILHARAAVAAQADAVAERRRVRAAARRDARDAARLDRPAARSRPASGFPEKVTAFRDGMAVHGRFRQPCPVCGTPVQRIVYADERVQLLRALPDRRPPARRPVAVAAAQGRLARRPIDDSVEQRLAG